MILFVMVMGSGMLFAQVGINDDGSSPNPAAGLDVKFSNKGFLLPRLSLTQRDAIANPPQGLMIFCTDCGSDGSVSVWTNNAWRTFTFCFCSVPAAGINAVVSGQITWTWNAVPEATGYKWNTVNNYSTAVDMGTALTKTETGITCNLVYTRYVWAYNTCSVSLPVTLTQSALPCSWACGDTLTINHVTSGGVAPINKTAKYGTLTNVPGEATKCWTTSNLGATHQATAVSDTTEASGGWYWQFNRKQGIRYGIFPNWIWINQNSEWLTANDPCALELGTGWRIPTMSEWTNVFNAGGWTSWNGPWGSVLKIHAAGHLDKDWGELFNRGIDGWYWSSTQNGNEIAWSLGFWNGYCAIRGDQYKASGFTLRCLKNMPVD